MLPFVIALIVMLIGVWVIYLLLKNMGEAGIEAAAPGSCRSGQCGVRCTTHTRDEATEAFSDPAPAAESTGLLDQWADGRKSPVEGPDLPGDTRRGVGQ